MTTTANPSAQLKAVILAAGVGSRIRPLTDERPKTLLTVGTRTILERMLTTLQRCGIEDTLIIAGYLGEKIESFVSEHFGDMNIEFLTNTQYQNTNTAYSLMLAEAFIGGAGFVKFDGDVVFDERILRKLLAEVDGSYLCIDRNIQLEAEEVKVSLTDGSRIALVSKSLAPAQAIGESIGIERISASTGSMLFERLHAMMKDPANRQDYYEAAYESLIADGVAFHAIDISGLAWTEIDTRHDLDLATGLFA